MLNLRETITVTCTPPAAFDYLARFANIRQWDPSVLEARQISAGVPRVGTRFRLMLQFGARPVPMDYRITELAAPHRLVLQGAGASFTAEDRIALAPIPEGTRITYEADICFHSSWEKTIEALAGPVVRRSGRRALQRLQRCLSGGGPAPRLALATRMVDQAILPGAIGFTRLGYRLGKHRWPLPAAPLHGRTVVLTGGTSGIGRATAFQLVSLGARLVMVGRSEKKTAEVARELRGAGGDVSVEIADLALMADIRALARRMGRAPPRRACPDQQRRRALQPAGNDGGRDREDPGHRSSGPLPADPGSAALSGRRPAVAHRQRLLGRDVHPRDRSGQSRFRPGRL